METSGKFVNFYFVSQIVVGIWGNK